MSDFIPQGFAPLRHWLEAQSRERLPARWAFIEKCKARRQGELLTLELSFAEAMALMPGARGPLARKALKRVPSQLARCLQSKHLLRQFSAVRECLYAGEVGAVVIAEDGSIGAIPSVFWGGSQAVGVVETGRRDGRRVLIRLDDIQGELSGEKLSAPAKRRLIRECREWFESERRRSPDRQPKTKAQYLAEALTRFPGLTKNGAENAWDQAARNFSAPGWGRRGRRPGEQPEIEGNNRGE